MTTAQTHPMIGMPPSALGALHQALGAGRGAAEAAEVARRFGFAAGPAFHGALQAALDQESLGPVAALDRTAFWDRISRFFADAGWGSLTFEPSHPGIGILRAASWAEAEGRTSRHPACHITTGMLAALMSRIAGADLAVLEVECRSAGAEGCVFLVGAPAALQAVYARIRAGEAYPGAVAALD